MIQSILALFQALPRILDLVDRIGKQVQTQQFQAWISDLEGTIDALEKADTAEAKRAAARGLVGIIRRI